MTIKVFFLAIFGVVFFLASCSLPNTIIGGNTVNLSLQLPGSEVPHSTTGRFLSSSSDNFTSTQQISVTASGSGFGTITQNATKDGSGNYVAQLSIPTGSDRTISAKSKGPNGAIFAQGSVTIDISTETSSVHLPMVPVENYPIPSASPPPTPFTTDHFSTTAISALAGSTITLSYGLQTTQFTTGDFLYLIDDQGNSIGTVKNAGGAPISTPIPLNGASSATYTYISSRSGKYFWVFTSSQSVVFNSFSLTAP